jgi:hypothetical protein
MVDNGVNISLQNDQDIMENQHPHFYVFNLCVEADILAKFLNF